jgi:hypothetical protein
VQFWVFHQVRDHSSDHFRPDRSQRPPFFVQDSERKKIVDNCYIGSAASPFVFSQLYGEIYTTENADSCALWIRPEHHVPFGRVVRPGIRTAHWYLMALCVEPSVDREIIGAALIEPILARADSTGIPCYGETFDERKVRFFGAHRFRIMGAGQLGREGPQFWTMIRAPTFFRRYDGVV